MIEPTGPEHTPKQPTDTCRPVMVDGEIIRVLGDAEMDATDREMFAEIVRAAKRKFAAEGGS